MSPLLHTLTKATLQPLSKRALFSTTRANMSQEWLVILPDVPGKLEDRMAVRPQHLGAITPLVQAGRIVMGGATLDEHPKAAGDKLQINGSAMLVVADSRQQVLDEIVKKDIYAQRGVWDLEKVQIYPFKSAVRKEL